MVALVVVVEGEGWTGGEVTQLSAERLGCSHGGAESGSTYHGTLSNVKPDLPIFAIELY